MKRKRLAMTSRQAAEKRVWEINARLWSGNWATGDLHFLADDLVSAKILLAS